jgi:hypothetical protein
MRALIFFLVLSAVLNILLALIAGYLIGQLKERERLSQFADGIVKNLTDIFGKFTKKE